MDAPLHFVENGRPIDQIPMEQLAGNGKMNSSFLYHLGGLSMPQGLQAHISHWGKPAKYVKKIY